MSSYLKLIKKKKRNMGNELGQHIDQSQKTGVLQLRNFKLTKVPPELFNIAQFLRNLDLSSNRIQQLPGSLFTQMQLLKTLNLSNNKLEFLPNEIARLTKLETLNLSENQLRSLPGSIAELKSVKTINLSKNNLSEISRELCLLKQLNHLDLSSNRITQINDYIEELSAVELNLNENQIKQISPNVAKCQRLKVLRLEQNVLEISAIPTSLLTDSQVALISYEGNLFNQKQFEKLNGYEKVILCNLFLLIFLFFACSKTKRN